jgi:hypothetical protein
MPADPADLRRRLQAIADELADLAIERLEEAIDAGATTSPVERRITRARRSVEKAVELLSDEGTDAS